MNPEIWEYALTEGAFGRFIFRLSWDSENRARLATANQRVIRKALRKGCSAMLEQQLSSGQAQSGGGIDELRSSVAVCASGVAAEQNAQHSDSSRHHDRDRRSDLRCSDR